MALADAVATGADETPVTQPNHSHIRFGGLVVGAGYYGFYDSFRSSPFIHPGSYTAFMQQPNMGQVKLETVDKDASVYVDGADAGSARKLKSFWLAPGVHNLELRDDKQRSSRQRVYMLSGKTLAIRPRATVDDYRAHDEQNGITIAADVMDSEQARHAFTSSVFSGYAVVEVAVCPEAGKRVDLSSMDFTLRVAGHASPIRPSSARTIAAVLHRKAAQPAKSSDVTLYPTVGVGYESGGYDPVYGGNRRGGWRTNAGVQVAAGGARNGQPRPASTDRDRTTMEMELDYCGDGATIHISSPAGSKRK